MSEDTQEIKNKSKSTSIDDGSNLTNAEKIKNFQKQAKEIQYEINKIKARRDQTHLKLNDLNPIFESYRNDYQKVMEIINNEEKRIAELQIEMKNEIKDNKQVVFEDIEQFMYGVAGRAEGIVIDGKHDDWGNINGYTVDGDVHVSSDKKEDWNGTQDCSFTFKTAYEALVSQ